MDAYVALIEKTHAAFTIVPCLLILAVMGLAWFPGHNARRWDSNFSSFINAGGWAVGGVGTAAYMFIDSLYWLPVILLLWVTLVVASYGRTLLPPHRAKRTGGFEVILSTPMNASAAC